MLELAILGLLKEQELHGYELKKRLVETLGFASGVSFGSLYPALARLEAAGAVKAVESRVAPPVPATGSLGGELAALRARKPVTRGSRGKKVYGITERGEQLFEELLAAETQSSDDDRVFNLRLAFARYLPPDARIGMLERRRAHLVERLIQLRVRVQAARDTYARSLVEHDREAAEHDLSWIERLIAAERAGRQPEPERRSPTTGATGAVSRIARHGPTISGLRPVHHPTSPEEDD
ncbi:MAG: PadR family transcriptional regulator [Actinomycetota bacterium]|nr:PadR family transcriptional regulator [Actinomycetota bacterium]